MGKRFFYAVAVLFCVAATGCATQSSKLTPEERVAALSQKRLDALLAGDLKKAYGFLSPAYRSGVTFSRYSAFVAGVGTWKEAEVKSVNCEEQLCKVAVGLTYKSPMVKEVLTTTLNERWLNIDGKWWYYQK